MQLLCTLKIKKEFVYQLNMLLAHYMPAGAGAWEGATERWGLLGSVVGLNVCMYMCIGTFHRGFALAMSTWLIRYGNFWNALLLTWASQRLCQHLAPGTRLVGRKFAKIYKNVRHLTYLTTERYCECTSNIIAQLPAADIFGELNMLEIMSVNF